MKLTKDNLEYLKSCVDSIQRAFETIEDEDIDIGTIDFIKDEDTYAYDYALEDFNKSTVNADYNFSDIIPNKQAMEEISEKLESVIDVIGYNQVFNTKTGEIIDKEVE